MDNTNAERVGVVGLGYVGLPVALAMSKVFRTVGFDVNPNRIAELCEGKDASCEVTSAQLAACRVVFTSDVEALANCTFIVVAVPTPLDAEQRPDLSALMKATELVGAQLEAGAVVVFESTVYPGLTESVCGPLLERVSGLVVGRDFFLAYSPERINPGDKDHGFEHVRKVVAAQDEHTLERVAAVYSAVVEAGVYRAASIAVAEAAKIVENTQRDVNIALMNEFASVFDRLGIRTSDVLAAARTKWNFVGFEPGLVGGQCVGVAPLYLSAKAQMHGYQTDIIRAARRTNDDTVRFVADKVLALIRQRGLSLDRATVGVLGATFKANVSDVRNSAVPKMLTLLRAAGVTPLVHDPHIDTTSALQTCGTELSEFEALRGLDVLVYAVNHRFYLDYDLTDRISAGGIFVDVKSQYDAKRVQARGITYWSL